jgi:LPXTG-site transpeptidase (sortase) family protein
MRKVSLITSGVVMGLILAMPSSALRVDSVPTRQRPAEKTTREPRAGARRPAPASTRAATVARDRGPAIISIPRIGVTALIRTSLGRGPIFWKKVGRPGQGTTIAIAAHDVTPVPGFQGHGPFHDIDRIRKRDRIYVTWAGTRYSYLVTGQRLIRSTNMHIADLTRHERLLLTTCWPRGSGDYRLVVYALPRR